MNLKKQHFENQKAAIFAAFLGLSKASANTVFELIVEVFGVLFVSAA